MNSDNQKALKYLGLTFIEEVEEVDRLSHLGTPIIHPIKFVKGNYNSYDDNNEKKVIGLDDLYLPAATLVDFSRAKILSKSTPIKSMFTITEIYGFKAWKIRIRGLCLDQPNYSAKEQLKDLLKWERVIQGVDIESKLFNDKEIYTIVIDEIQMQQIKGKSGVMPFTITASSVDNALQFLY